MSEMTKLEQRCVDAADHATLKLINERDRLAIVRGVLAEAGVAEMREALQAVIDGHGCQPGYLSAGAMQIARAALAKAKP